MPPGRGGCGTASASPHVTGGRGTVHVPTGIEKGRGSSPPFVVPHFTPLMMVLQDRGSPSAAPTDSASQESPEQGRGPPGRHSVTGLASFLTHGPGPPWPTACCVVSGKLLPVSGSLLEAQDLFLGRSWYSCPSRCSHTCLIVPVLIGGSRKLRASLPASRRSCASGPGVLAPTGTATQPRGLQWPFPLPPPGPAWNGPR